MTTVEVHFRIAAPPSEEVAFALANIREVYGIRRFRFDRAAGSLCVEYDATRLNKAAVANLVRQAGLEIETQPRPAQPLHAPEEIPIA